MSKRTRNLVVLLLIALVTAALLVFALLGFSYGINKIVPMRSAIKRGMDYGIGRTTVYQIADEADRSAENQAKDIETINARLENLGLSGVRVYAQGNDKIRIDIPRKQHYNTTSETGLQEEALSFASTQAQFYLKDPAEKTIFNSGNITHAEAIVMTNSDPVTYGVLIHLDEPATERLAAATEGAMSGEDAVLLEFGYDEVVVADLSVSEPIEDGRLIIRNNFGAESAGRLESLINSGPLATGLTEMEHFDGDPMQGAGVYPRITNAIGLALLVVMLVWIVLYKSSGLMATLSMLLTTFLFLLGYATMDQVLITPAGLAGALAGLVLALGFHSKLLENLSGDLYQDQDVLVSIKTAVRQGVAPVLDCVVMLIIAGVVGMLFGGEMIEDFSIPMLVGVGFALVGYFLCSGLLVLMAGVDGKQSHYKRLGSPIEGSVRASKAL